jgi:hypothetical protein
MCSKILKIGKQGGVVKITKTQKPNFFDYRGSNLEFFGRILEAIPKVV